MALIVAASLPVHAAVVLYFEDQAHYGRAIKKGDVHPYSIALEAGEFVRFVAEPQGVDIALALESPSGKRIATIDQISQTMHPETLSAVAEVGGRYRLLVSSKWATAGTYEIRLDERRSAEASDSDRIEAERLFSEAEKLEKTEDRDPLQTAEEKYRRAFLLWSRVSDRYGQADALNSIGVAQLKQGYGREALASFLAALSVHQCIEGAWPRTDILSDVSVAFQELGQERLAIAYAEAGFQAAGDARERAFTLYNAAQALARIGEAKAALTYFLQALPEAEASGDVPGAARTVRNIGDTYGKLGEWREALLFYDRSLKLARSVGEIVGEAITLSSLGSLYSNWGNYDKALDYYQRSLARSKDGRSQRTAALALHRMGDIYRIRGETSRAIESYELARKAYREARFRSDEAMALAGIGRVRAEQGDYAQALTHYAEALATARERLQRAYILDAIAVAQAESGRYEEAIVSASEAIDIFRNAGHRQGEAEALYARARARVRAQSLAVAREDAEAALRLIEHVRGSISTFEARASFLATYSDVSDLLINVLMRLHQAHPSGGFARAALETNERLRARTLIDYLSQAPLERGNAQQHALQKRQREIRALLSAKTEAQLKVMGRAHSQEIAAGIGREMDELSVEFDQIAARLRAFDPRTAAMDDGQSLRLPSIQRDVLDPGTVLLEYFLGAEKSYVWLVTEGAVEGYELPPRSDIETAVRRAHDALSTPGTASRDALAPLTSMVIPAALAKLKATRVLVVADGALHYLPFAALPSPRDPALPLLADYEVVNIPSASTVAVLRSESRRPAPTKSLAVFADPVFTTKDERVQSPNQLASAEELSLESDVVRSAKDTGLADGVLPRLPFTRREANALMSLVPAAQRKVALDFAASRHTALSKDLRNYRIVHFATHGLLNSFRPELSGIVLSMVDAKGKEQRGFLSVADVFNMSLAADLVVLSGCRTALGKEVKGEGISGFTRAFMYAGAPRVVASVWKVSDAATAELMKRFYGSMLGPEKLPPAAALRAAQLSLRGEKRWSDPYYWAAFTIQGDWR